MDAAFDINDVDVNAIPNHDILCAGFPCQPFSHAGKQLGRNCGKNGNLIDNVIRTLEAKRPKYLMLENVPTLLSHNKGQTFAEIKMALEGLGYYVEHNKYSPRHFGIPQNRPRLFILGVRGRKRICWPEKPRKIKDKPNALKLMLDKIHFQCLILTLIHRLYVWCLALSTEGCTNIDLFPKSSSLLLSISPAATPSK